MGVWLDSITEKGSGLEADAGEGERILGYSKLMKDVNYRKEREKNIGKLEQIYNEQSNLNL